MSPPLQTCYACDCYKPVHWFHKFGEENLLSTFSVLIETIKKLLESIYLQLTKYIMDMHDEQSIKE